MRRMGTRKTTVTRVRDDWPDDPDERVTPKKRAGRTQVPGGGAHVPPFGKVPTLARLFRVVRIESGRRSPCRHPSEGGVLVDRWPLSELSVVTLADRWGPGTYQARYLDTRGTACGSSANVTINEAAGTKKPPAPALPTVITPEMYKLREMELRYMAEKQATDMRHQMLKEQAEFLERQLARATPAPTITPADVQRIVQESTQGAVQLARLQWENEQLKRGGGRHRNDDDDDDDDDDDREDEAGMLASAERMMGSFARVMESPVAGPVLAPALAALVTKLAANAPAPAPRAASANPPRVKRSTPRRHDEAETEQPGHDRDERQAVLPEVS
jgi:hypothetical protein